MGVDVVENKKGLVVKRDGREEPFSEEKLMKQLEFAINGVLPFEEVWGKVKVTIRKDKITTKELQERLIKSLSKHITADTPEYNLIVGRLYTWNLYRQVWKKTKFDITQWVDHINWLVKTKQYKQEVTDYLQKLNSEAKTLVNEHIKYTSNQDFNKVYIQVVVLNEKDYIIKDKRKPLEYPILMDIADALILSEGASGKFIKFFKALHYGKLSLATPFKRNLRRYKGNLGSCFIGETDDNLASITKTYSDVSFISKYGGGIGWYLSKIRPEGSRSNSVLQSVKVNKWVKVLNDIIVATTQGGGTRKGLITPALDWWHLDIHEFLSIKSELDGDIRDKAFDIFPQIVVDNYFMQKVKDDELVCLFDHYTYLKKFGVDVTELFGDELYKHYQIIEDLVRNKKLRGEFIKAKALWRKMLWVWVEIGDEYIFNRDNANKSNYLSDQYITKCGNACQESFSITKASTTWREHYTGDTRVIDDTDGIYHSCNLISINLSNLVKAEAGELKEIASLAVEALDKSIDLSDYPVLEAKRGSESLRNIGIGFVGMADYLAYYNKTLNSEGVDLAESVVEFFTYHCYKHSVELARLKGAYPLFRIGDYSKLLGRDPKELNKLSKNGFDWVALQSDIRKYGIRNFYLMAIAPNTTTAGIMNATASYLPVYSKEMYQTFSNFSVPVIPKYIKDHYWEYKTKWQYTPSDIVAYTRRIQIWIDTGISMEVNINPELTTIKDISDSLIDGFLSGELKAVYYSLTIDSEKENTCTDCAN